jgi:hypothetical protein
MFEHELFEDLLDRSPGAPCGLSLRYRDVFDLIDAVGWNPEKTDSAKRRFEVPLTEDLINLLGLRRYDLVLTINHRISETARSHPRSSTRSPPTASPSALWTASFALTPRPLRTEHLGPDRWPTLTPSALTGTFPVNVPGTVKNV